MEEQAVLRDAAELFSDWLGDRAEQDDVPGYAAAIIHEDDEILAEARGTADTASDRSFDSDTACHLASVSKFFTATAVMTLVESGRLSLDDRVSDHLSFFDSDATVRDVLQHRGLLFRDGNYEIFWEGDPPTTAELEELVSDDPTVPLEASTFKYSNIGYGVLGLLIEAVTGQSYEEYLSENVFDPLGLDHTSVDDPGERGDLATGYRTDDGERVALDRYRSNGIAPAAGLISTATDLSHVLQAVLTDQYVLTAGSLQAMRDGEPVVDEVSYGLGHEIYEMGDWRLYGHEGIYLGFTDALLYHPESGLGIVVLTNGHTTPAMDYAKAGLHTLLTALEDRGGGTGGPDDLSGTYEHELWGEIRMHTVGDRLLFYEGLPDLPLEHYAWIDEQDGTRIVRGGRGFGVRGEPFTAEREDGEVTAVHFGPYTYTRSGQDSSGP